LGLIYRKFSLEVAASLDKIVPFIQFLLWADFFMKTIQIHAHGGPDVLTYENMELPPPARGEVRLRIRAIGLNFIDVYYRTGLYPAPSFPFIPGDEAAGEVIGIGENVRGFRIGDRVAYVSNFGSYAEERNIRADELVKLPVGVKFETAAAMMLKGLTAHYLLRKTFKVGKGHIILNHAAAGGVGLILGQWARSLGATVIGTVGSDEKMAIARKIGGCHHVINYRKEDFAKRVAEITEGKRCHVVYDGVGKDTFEGSLDCLRPLGMFVSYGNASGPVEPFSLRLLAQKGSLFATRPTLFTHLAQPGYRQKAAAELFDAVLKKAVSIKVNSMVPLKDAARAHRDLESRTTTGATVLIP